MNANEYQQLALRTEYSPEFINVGAIEGASAISYSRLFHAALGVCTEAGELQDALKKHLIYGKPFDAVNVMEECSDILWYLALALDAVGCSLEDCMQRNIDKLRARFPNKFTAAQALHRDLDAERTALEG